MESAPPIVSLPGIPPLTNEQKAILATCPSAAAACRSPGAAHVKKEAPSQQGQNVLEGASEPLTVPIEDRGRLSRDSPFSHRNSHPRKYSLSNSNNNVINNKGQLTRITAAAGSGKTTTLLALALHAIQQQGHGHLTYVTFTNAAATDGQERLYRVLQQQQQRQERATPPRVDARTIHSCAHRLLQEHMSSDSNQHNQPGKKLWTDDKPVKRWIAQQCRAAIDEYLQPCVRELRQRPAARVHARSAVEEWEHRAREMVELFIFKSLTQFCQSAWTRQEYAQGKMFNRDYYPAKLFHGPKGKGPDYGFPLAVYNKNKMYSFYADQAVLLWDQIILDDIRSFDFEMKRVQLLQLRVPGSILLVDESQDMDACQIDFIVRQQVELFGTHVYVVGDAVQSIYEFRGAKPGFLLNLGSDQDCMLTESWRFGPAISNLANVILYAKEHSEQTGTTFDGKPKHWIPYRTRPGLLDLPSRVTREPLIGEWRNLKVTVIARTNATLLLEALGVLGFVLDDNKQDDDGEVDDGDNDEKLAASDVHIVLLENDDDDEEEEETEKYFESVERASNSAGDGGENPSIIQPNDFPKIHINGRGEGSGVKLWKRSLKRVESAYELYKTAKEDPNATTVLDGKLFPDFSGKHVTWTSFVDECSEKELSEYNTVIGVVNMCGKKTMEAVEMFRTHVINNNFPAEQADIILTTCHSAKGAEWDNVHVCDDFVKFATFQKKKEKDPVPRDPGRSSPLKKLRVVDQYEFGFLNWGDDVNLAYVACTRAKKLLSVPKCIGSAIETLDAVHCFVQEHDSRLKKVSIHVPGQKNPLSMEEAIGFHESLVLPLRAELGLQESKQLLSEVLYETDVDAMEAFQ